MALVLKDRVQETTTVTGDSPAVLLGAIPGYQTFSASTPNASVVYYTIAGGTEWEVGYGTYYTNNNSVVRVTSQVYSSSNAGAIVDFSAGTKNIFVTLPAEQAIYQEINGDLRLVGGVIGLSIDGTEGNTLPNTSFQAFTTGNYYMQANQQNLDSGNAASADWVVTADNGSDTDNYMDMGMASSGYNYPDFSAQHPNTGYIISTGSELALVAGKYGANVAAANAASTDIVFTAGDLLTSGERARIKGSTGNIILSNTSNPTDDGSKLQVSGNANITGNVSVVGAVYATANVTAANQLVPRSYVDQAVSAGLHIHEPVRVAQGTNLTATYNNGSSGVGANLTNSGSQIALVIDTITANVSDRVLVYGQSNAVQNGVYVVSNTGSNSTNWVLTRSSDADTYAPQSDTGLGGGDYFYVQEGATQAGDSYVCTNTGNITFGVTNITFTQFSGAITYVGTSPINVSGQTISLSGVVDATHGGTGLSTYNTGDMIYANGANSLTNLTVGSSGQTLIVSGGAPAWGALDMAGSGVSGTLPANHGGTGYASYTIGEMLYSDSSTTLAKVIPNNTTTQKVLTQTGNGTTVTSTAWNQLSAGDITGLGTMATQNASSVAITGGSVNGTLIGNATPSSGAFTTLSASSTVSGTGFANYLNAPPSIGGVTPNTGAFTTLNASGQLTLTNASDYNLYASGAGGNYMAGRLGVGSVPNTFTTINIGSSLTGQTTNDAITVASTVASDVTSAARGVQSRVTTSAAAFTVNNIFQFYANPPAKGAGSTINNQFGFYAESSLTAATNNYGFYGNLAAATGVWNLYMNGTADNYLAGQLGVGVTPGSARTIAVGKNLTGQTTGSQVTAYGTIQSDVTANAYGFWSFQGTAAASFTLNSLQHFRAEQTTLGASSAVTNQTGFYVDSTLTGATNNYGFYGNIGSGTNRYNLYMAGTANNYLAGSLGIGSTSLSDRSLAIGKTITGATAAYGIVNNGVIQSDVTTLSQYYRTTASTAAASFTLTTLDHFSANQGTIGAGSAITAQAGFNVTSSLTGATNNYGFYGNIAAATGRYNLYMAGTADNYLAGSVGIGSVPTTASQKMLVAGAGLTASTFYTVDNQTYIPSTGTGTVNNYRSVLGTAASAFTVSSMVHYAATQAALGATSAVTNQTGFQVDSALTGATNNYGFYGNIAAATGRYNLYMNGTANNYMAGSLGIGTASPAYPLVVAGASNAAVTAQIYNANTNSSTQSLLNLNVGGKATNMSVVYSGNYFANQGTGGIVTSFTDYDTQYFRNIAGFEQFRISSTASANNSIQVTGGLGVGPTISAIGNDTNIDLKITPKGSGYANITSGGIKFPDATVQTTAATGAPAALNVTLQQGYGGF